jgi:hypothetical protein
MDLLVTAEEEEKQDLANRLDPQRVETQNAEMAKQAFKRARHDAHKAASLEPAYDKAWWRLAKANVGLREFTRARRALDLGLSRCPGNAQMVKMIQGLDLLGVPPLDARSGATPAGTVVGAVPAGEGGRVEGLFGCEGESNEAAKTALGLVQAGHPHAPCPFCRGQVPLPLPVGECPHCACPCDVKVSETGRLQCEKLIKKLLVT